MATYLITAPDGKKYKITAPDNASPEEIQRRIQQFQRTEPEPLSVPQAPGDERLPSKGIKEDIGNALRTAGEFIGRTGKYEPLKNEQGDPIEEMEPGFIAGAGLGKRMKLSAGTWAETDPKHRVEIIRANLPEGFKVDMTPREDIVITNPQGEQRVWNARGLSWGDLQEVFGEAGKVAGVTRAIGNPATTLGLMGKTAAATAGMRSVEEVGGRLGGSSKIISPTEIAVDAAVAAAFAGITAKGVQLLRRLKTRPTTRLKIELKNELGVNIDDIPADIRQEMVGYAAKAQNPDQFRRLVRMKYMGVTPTNADIRQTPELYALQDRIARAGFKDGRIPAWADDIYKLKTTAVDEAGNPLALQKQQVAKAAQNVSRKITGAEYTDELGGNVGPTVSRLANDAAASLKEVNALYEAAKSQGARVSPGAARRAWRDIVKAGRDFDKTGPINSTIRDLTKILGDKKVTAVSLQKLENVRTRLTDLTQDSNKRVAGAARRALRAYDEHMETLGPDEFTAGSPEAYKAFETARKARRAHGLKYESNPIVKSASEKQMTETGDLDTVDPTDWANKLFSPKGALKTNAHRSIKALKNALGPDSPEFQAVKREVLGRLLKEGRPGLWQDSIKEFVRKQPRAARELFTREDLRELGILGDVARTANTVAPPNIANTSNTAMSLARMGKVGGEFPVATHVQKYIVDPTRATGPLFRNSPSPLAGPTGYGMATIDPALELQRLLQGQRPNARR